MATGAAVVVGAAATGAVVVGVSTIPATCGSTQLIVTDTFASPATGIRMFCTPGKETPMTD